MLRILLPCCSASLAVIGFALHTTVLPAGEWTTIGSMNVTREYPGLAVLPDGRVLAVTGHPLDGKSLASAELYDPKIDQWTPTGSLHVPRNGVDPDGLIMLPNGKVLITGGGSGNRSVHETELYDVDAGTWSLTGPMDTPRCVHTTTLLDSGQVLATGGIDWLTDEVHASTEVYDPETGQWTNAGAMHTARFIHRAVKLSNGNVLVTGGLRDYPEEGQVTASAEIYDVQTGAWRKTAPMHTARRSHGAVLLADGRVLVAGGSTGGFGASRHTDSVEIYDPKTETWSDAAPLKEGRWGPTINRLRDGRVLVTGGAVRPIGARQSAEVFDPRQNTWSDAGRLAQARNGHRSIMLPDGRVLIAGGHYVGRYLPSCEVYTPD